MITPCYVRLLGTLSVQRGDEKIERFRTQKTAVLLAYLCRYAARERVHGREELIDRFWPDDELDAGRNNLRVALSSLRKILEPVPVPAGSVLVTTRTHVSIRPETIRTDVDDFEAALQAHDDHRALALYDEGSFLPGIYDDWAITEGERIAALAEEAQERIQRQTGTSRPMLPFLPTPLPFPNNLPVTTDRFFGREEEATRLEMLLLNPGTRLVTIQGMGGTGKTRLAIEVARRLLTDKNGEKVQALRAGGIWFVPLAGQHDAAGLALTLPILLRETMGLPPQPRVDPLTQVSEALAGRDALFVLDNLEQVADAAFTVLLTLLDRLPSATFLVTSRIRLGVKGERVVALTPFPLPEPGEGQDVVARNPATLLFVDRARAVETEFSFTAANATDIARLLHRLEGIPLAIELAAAWANVLTPRQINDQLTARSNTLSERRPDRRVARHHSLEATFHWSYDLLEPHLRPLLASLSVFQGGFTVEDAANICYEEESQAIAIFSHLSRLHQCSLLTTRMDTKRGEVRFSLLEALREFAHAQLAPDAQQRLAARHALHYCELAEAAKRKQGTPASVDALNQMEAERANLYAAIERASREQNAGNDLALRLAASQQWLWTMRGPVTEGRRLLEQVLALPGRPETPARADALNALGSMAYFQGDYPEAQTRFRESIVLCRQLPHSTGLIVALSNFATTLMDTGERDAAEPLFQEALTVARETNDLVRQAVILFNLGNLAHWRRDLDEAQRLHEESLTIREGLGDTRGLGLSFTALGILAMEKSDYEDARARFLSSLPLQRELGDLPRFANTLDNLARAEEGLSHYAEAVRLRGVSDAMRRELKTPLAPERQQEWDRENAVLQEKLGKAIFDAAWAEGARRSWESVAEELT